MFYAAIFFCCLLLLFLLWDIKKPYKYPPGPRWLPIFGSALQISQLRLKHGMLCKAIDELSKYYVNPYGLYGLKLGRDKLVVAYYNETIREMMTNEDLDGKPDNIFFRTRTFNSRIGILITDGDFWLEQRRFILNHLKDVGFARTGMMNIVQNEAMHLIKDLKTLLAENQGKPFKHQINNMFQVYVLNSIWTMMASKRYDSNSPELLVLLELFFELFKNVDMFGTMFSHFPILRHLAPSFSGYSTFVQTHKRFYDFIKHEVDNHAATYKNYAQPRDLIDSYLHEIANPNAGSSFTQQQLLSVCLDMFLSGSETTNKSFGFGFLHLVRNPEIQDRAYEEIKKVVGLHRLPEWGDRPNLPYMEGIVLEAVRFFVGHTFGLPHRAIKDTRLCGYNIPKDTMVVACFRGMVMNPVDFPDPFCFKPERYMKDGVFTIPDAYNPFGLGRHRCMGDILAKQNLFVLTAAVLQNFRIVPLVNGEYPDDTPLDGATATVKPFDALVVPRDHIKIK